MVCDDVRCESGVCRVCAHMGLNWRIRSSWLSHYLKMAVGPSSTKRQTWSYVLWRNILLSDLEQQKLYNWFDLNWWNRLVRGSLVFSFYCTTIHQHLHHLLLVYGDTNSGQVFASSNHCEGNEEGKCVAWLSISRQLRHLSNFGSLMLWTTLKRRAKIRSDHMGILSGIFRPRINAKKAMGRSDFHLEDLLVVFSVP